MEWIDKKKENWLLSTSALSASVVAVVVPETRVGIEHSFLFSCLTAFQKALIVFAVIKILKELFFRLVKLRNHH